MELINQGLDTSEIRKLVGASRSYVQRLKAAYRNEQKLFRSMHSKRGPKPAMNELKRRYVFDVMTSRDQELLQRMTSSGSRLWTLERAQQFISLASNKEGIGRLQAARYLREIGLYHDNPQKQILADVQLSRWKDGEYIGIKGMAEDDGADIYYINTSMVTREYVDYSFSGKPVDIKDKTKNLILILWAINTKGKWWFMCTSNKAKESQTCRFIDMLISEINKPMTMLISKNINNVFNNKIQNKYRNKGVKFIPLPFELLQRRP